MAQANENMASLNTLDDSSISFDGMVVDQITEWYQKIPSRRVDLVGDYAGKELFLIEGDSLLLQCFADDSLDFEGEHKAEHSFLGNWRLTRLRWLSNAPRHLSGGAISSGSPTA